MGKSLFNSWLRHVKECQIVQNSWKISPSWKLQHETDLFSLMQAQINYLVPNITTLSSKKIPLFLKF